MNIQRLKILLVEDHRGEAVLLRKLLESVSGQFELTWVDRLEKATALAVRESFDAVLLDLTLPDAFGLETLERFQETTRTFPIIIVTGIEDEEMAVRAIRQGAQDYLVKGTFDGRTAARSIRYAIDRKKQEEEIRTLNIALENRVRERTSQLRSLTLELIQTEQRERDHLASILHDHLQQLLVASKLGICVSQQQVDPAQKLLALDKVSGLLDEAITASKTLAMELSPPILMEVGLVAAVRWLGEWMNEKHHIRVEVISESEIKADPEGICILLFRSIRELLFNTVKHSGSQIARVSLRWVENDRLEIVVWDEGRGFDPNRSDSERLLPGSGLRSIRERLDLLGGIVDITTSPGLGTRVRLTAPLSRRETTCSSDSDPNNIPLTRTIGKSLPSQPVKKIRVLIVDDHTMLREGLVHLLQCEPDIDVIGAAEDGESAIELNRRLRPDIIIMDVNLPGIDGVEATRRIVTEFPGSRIIGLSMHDSMEQKSAMIRAGALTYLHKGGPSERLIAAIRSTAT